MHAGWLETDYTVERAYDGDDAFRKLDETVVVRVADNGPGIPDRCKERIFADGE